MNMYRPRSEITGRKAALGFSFIELVISLVVIGIAVTGVLLVFTQTVGSSADPLIRQQALAIAEAYLDEVISKHYDDPDGVDGEGARAAFDDIDDYSGLNEAPTRGTGAAVAELAAYTVNVIVGGATSIGPGGNQAVARLITVTVSHSGATVITLSGFRTDYQP
ncbi:MAG: pilus assembly protein MshD [Proteobacteria bacterium]|nr:pilus assembly protein MshD [Pseudomonadota bacterium]